MFAFADNGKGGRASPVHHEGTNGQCSTARLRSKNRIVEPNHATREKNPAYRSATGETPHLQGFLLFFGYFLLARVMHR
jgi:hypothetical protein